LRTGKNAYSVLKPLIPPSGRRGAWLSFKLFYIVEIILEKQSEVNALLKVSVQESDYQEKLEKSIKELGKQVVIKGFRPGKVPPGLIKQRFGKDLKIEEVNKLVVESLENYLKEEKLKILAAPMLNREKASEINWLLDTLEFEYELGLVPPFQYQLDKNVVVEQYKVQLTGTELDEIVANMRESQSESTEADIISEDDFIRGQLRQEETGFDGDLTFPVSQIKPEIKSLLIGKPKDEPIEIADIQAFFEKESGLRFAINLPEEKAAALSGTFIFTPALIYHREPAEMNPAFFEKVLNHNRATNEAEFREELRQTVEKDYSISTDNLLKREIGKMLVKNTEIPLPDDFLQRFIIFNNEDKYSAEEVAKSYESYKDSLKQGLIETRIAEDFEIMVENEEVVTKAKDLFRETFARYRSGGEEIEEQMEGMIHSFLTSEKGDNYKNIYNQVFSDKVMAKVKELITIEDKVVSSEEFNKIAEEMRKQEEPEEEEMAEEAETKLLETAEAELPEDETEEMV
jgi:trigger factor